MKFLRSEGRVVCLLEREDALATPPAQLPQIDLLLVARHIRDEIENSHLWDKLQEAVPHKSRIIEW
jgi:hypothetical protein